MKISKKQLKKIIRERMKKFSSDDFKDVYNTARMAHVGQTRRDGSEYFSHPSEVRNIARKFYPGDNVVQMAALLHDSLEDAPGSTVSSVEEMEDFIKGSIQDQSSAREVIRVVRALTHEKGGSYTDYVLGLLGDVPTLRVKLADMVHNLSDSPRPKQKAKYREALDAISSQTSGRAPSGISPQHWQELLDLTEGKEIKITKRQLRKVIREALSTEVPELTGGRKSSWQVKKEKELAAKRVLATKLKTSESLTTPEQFRQLQPGDNLSLNGKPVVVIGVSPMTGEVDYVDRGKATRKYFDYRMALVDEPGEMPEYDVVYLGPGEPPQNTRLPRR